MLRVSTKDGRQDVENQLLQLRDYCAKQKWEIVREYVDHDTGATPGASISSRCFADARARTFDLVLFWWLDRFSREGVSATLQHLERLTQAGVNWRSFTEEFLDSTGVFRDAIIAILAAIASQERTRRSERARAVQRLRRQGKTDHLGRNRVLIGHKLERIRQLHEEGLSLRAIGKQLNVSPMTVLRALELRRSYAIGLASA